MAKKLIASHLITTVCKKLGIEYSYGSKDTVVVIAHLPKKDHLIINFNLGLISNTEASICLDKAYQYELLEKVIKLPKTKTYLDPKGEYASMGDEDNVEAIVKDIENNFSYPLIVKKNKGSEGKGVFLCQNKKEVIKAVQTVFSHQNKNYDHVLLAQEYINIKNEYRAIFYKQNLEILYKKDNQQSNFVGNLSPLHFDKAKAVDITDNKLKKEISEFIQPVFEKLNLKYTGIDIAEDDNGQYHLIELNSNPAFDYYIKDNGEEKVLSLFEKIIGDLKKT